MLPCPSNGQGSRLSAIKEAHCEAEYNDLDMLIKWDGWCMADGHPKVVAAVRPHCSSVADLVEQIM